MQMQSGDSFLRLILFVASLTVAIGLVYFFVLSPTPADRLSRGLAEATGLDGTVNLDGCNISLVVESVGQESSPIALTRVVIRADLRNYNLKTVRFIRSPKGFGLRIDRGPVNDSMLIQASSIIDAGADLTEQPVSEVSSLKEFLGAKNTSLFFRVMAKVVTTEDGTKKFIAHEDAPRFYQFVEAVEALPAPVTYRTTSTFLSGEISSDSFITGRVDAIPSLQFSLGSEDQAKILAHAFHDYAAATGCE